LLQNSTVMLSGVGPSLWCWEDVVQCQWNGFSNDLSKSSWRWAFV